MAHDCCVHELPNADGERKPCKCGKGEECVYCHVAHPEVLKDGAKAKDDFTDGEEPLNRTAVE